MSSGRFGVRSVSVCMKRPNSEPERIATERRLATEHKLTFPGQVLGLPPTATSSLTQTRVLPPTLPAPNAAPRVAPPRARHARLSGQQPSAALLRATIEDQLRRVQQGDRHLMTAMFLQYGNLAAQAEPGPELSALRRRVLSAAFGADIGETLAAKKGAGPLTRRVV
jgi:hypothetical protein